MIWKCQRTKLDASSRTKTRVHICDKRKIGTPLVGDKEVVDTIEEEAADEFVSMVIFRA